MVNAKRNVDLMLVHRLRRWPHIKSALSEYLVFAEEGVVKIQTIRISLYIASPC